MDIATLKAAFSKKSNEGNNDETNTGFWQKFFPFYKMDLDETVEFRFLPDLDDENPLGFIVENRYHELLINGKKKRIACSNMYGEPCMCCDLSKKHYDEGDEALGKKFWRKIDYIAQGVIISTPFEYPIKDDENPVRMLSLSTKLYKVIESKIVKGDLDEMPYDMISGYNFKIYKTKQGEYSDYTTSDFARKSTQVPDIFLSKIELYDLKNFRYGKIERDQMEVMVEAFLTGRSLETETEKPVVSVTGSPTLDAKLEASKATQAAETVVQQMAAPVAEVTSASIPPARLSPQEILAKLKANRSA